MNKDKKRIRLWSYLLMGVALVLVVVSLFTTRKKSSDTFNHYIELADNWTMEYRGEETQVTLPTSLHAKQGESFTISHRMTEEETKIAGDLYVVIYYCDLNIYLDGELYDSYRYPATRTQKTEGMKYLFFAMPENMQGKTLTLEFFPQMTINNYHVSEPWYGYQMDIFAKLAKERVVDVVLVVSFLVLGVVLLIVGIWSKELGNNDDWSLIALGIFACDAGIYLGAQLEFLRVLLQAPKWMYFAELTSLMLIMVPVLLLLMEAMNGTSRKIIKITLFFNLVVDTVQLLLYYFTPLEMREMLTIMHITLLTSILMSLYCIFVRRESEGEYKKELVIAIIPAGIGAFLEVFLHYSSNLIQIHYIFKLGLIVFIIIEIYYNVRRFRKHLAQEQENEFYRRIAYLDIATGIQNRNAYEKACEEIESNRASYQTVAGIVFDLNNLKVTNDTMGHAEGDAMIKMMADTVKNLFADAYGVYRTGGDEFIVLLTDITENELQEKINCMETRRKECVTKTGNVLNYSIGYTMYDGEKHKMISDMIKEADDQMYYNKRVYHQNN